LFSVFRKIAERVRRTPDVGPSIQIGKPIARPTVNAESHPPDIAAAIAATDRRR
jgi:hypothetical protein